ncbi:SMAD/FHA domain-containing protein [Dichotomocladium elegans]|nr:SMAD/FHA domain-containing protein [Dichotomocladium elegans]
MSTASSASSLSEHQPGTQPQSQPQQQQIGPNIRLVPNLGMDSRSYVFEVIERTIPPGVVYKIGRYSDRNVVSDRLSFRSKVVSRTHAQLWVDESHRIFLRDTGSSSGTFVNRVRLSQANVPSGPQEIKDGDLIQLGVDYQGGAELMYRAVRIRVEVNRGLPTVSRSFSRHAFQQLRQHLASTVATTAVPKNTISTMREPGEHPTTAREEIQECCICLYAIAPLQALFISPCSHIFHFKCLHPILIQNYPGFACPICRTYSDLEASVAVEPDELLEAIGDTEEEASKECDENKCHDDDTSADEPTEAPHLSTLTPVGPFMTQELSSTLVSGTHNFGEITHALPR